MIRHGKRLLRETPTELDKALDSNKHHHDHTRNLQLYHNQNEEILEQAMLYVDYMNRTMKRQIYKIKNEIHQINTSSKTTQNTPKIRHRLKMLEGTHQLLMIQKQAKAEQILYTSIRVTKDMASKRFYESMRQYKKIETYDKYRVIYETRRNDRAASRTQPHS